MPDQFRVMERGVPVVVGDIEVYRLLKTCLRYAVTPEYSLCNTMTVTM
jgi:hypothetical protein